MLYSSYEYYFLGSLTLNKGVEGFNMVVELVVDLKIAMDESSDEY
jgi:hypothetical protein